MRISDWSSDVCSSDLAAELDRWQGEIVVSPDAIAAAAAKVPARLKEDIAFAYARVRDFAQRQRDSVTGFETELSPGLFAGQRLIPVKTAGCYVPGGRYAHVASAIMSIATAKVAGVGNILACSGPTPEHGGLHPRLPHTEDQRV